MRIMASDAIGGGGGDTRGSVLRSVKSMLLRPVTKAELLTAMVDRVVEALDAERGTLYLLDAVTGELVSRVAHLPELSEIRLPLGTGVAGRVAETGNAMLLEDVSEHEAFYPGIDERTGFTTRSMLAVPVRDEAQVVRGVLQVLNRKHGRFGERDRERLCELADEVADALTRTSMQPISEADAGLLIDGPFNHIVGDSPQMVTLYDNTLAASSTDATVLIRGESGTGKTLVARAIHDSSERRRGPLVHVDCTTLPASLIESELFGHERGAFTGADRRVEGKVETAAGGTLFLDEIGDLPLEAQGKLLRFLQEHAFERVGGRETLVADVRVISATNVDLEALIRAGRFRRDLYYRIRVVELSVPPLRERGAQDIRRLAEHFLARFARRHRRPTRALSKAALERLCRHDWPGNVRELEHCIESAVVLSRAELIEPRHLSLPPASGADEHAGASDDASGYPPGMALEDVERDHIERTLAHCDGNQSEAARLLGIGRNTLSRKLKR
ncbi:MAG: sigma-54-dependent Fis family transcriptional regulator [Myxococcales bacterium]|nr:sigma-54-dependent Fis family transcriptional regulator [Myxococcales bacterium]